MHADLIDLRLFLHIHEAGSITGGAERSHMTLASASARVQALERALGTELLLRERRGVRPTPAGRTLAREARRVLAQLDVLQSEMAQHAGGPRAHLRLLANTSAARVHLPQLLARFLARHPLWTLDLRERPSADIADALRQQRAELGVLSDAVDTEGLECTVLRADPLVLIVPPAHRLAGLRRAGLQQALEEPFIGLHDDDALQAMVSALARRLAPDWDCRVRLGSLEAVCRMVALGAGVAVVPRAVAEREACAGALRRIALTDPWAGRRLLLAARRLDQLPAPMARLARYLIDAAGSGAQHAPSGVVG